MRPIFLAGEFVTTAQSREIRAPFSGEVVTQVCQAGEVELERAFVAAVKARRPLGETTTGQRRAWLTAVAHGLATRLEEIAQTIALEAGKPITFARGEVKRAIETFTLAASELTAARGELVPIDLDAGSAGYSASVKHVPAGIVAAISPFNFPLNLGAHKVAPALAVGAPCLWKPPPQAPSAALICAEIFREAGVLPGALSVLPCDNSISRQLATDPRVRVLSFTGSAKVGWQLRREATRARVLLELGGNAAAIVAHDADLELAAKKLAASAFAYAGQVCISTQRIFVEAAIAEAFEAKLIEAARMIAVGDPLDEKVVVSSVIDAAAADRIAQWIGEAKSRGARVLLEGARRGSLLSPTLLADVPRDCTIVREEVFGPVALVERFTDFSSTLHAVNDSEWGLQAALFTNDLRRVREAERVLEVGGLIINDSPSFRSDAYPYGGMKGSGLGREGLRAAMAEFTEPRVLVLAR